MKTITNRIQMPRLGGFLKTRFLPAFACLLLATIDPKAIAAPGDLDLTFGGTGKVTTVIGSDNHGQSVALQNDGKIVVAGFSSNGASREDFALARYDADGSLDTSFNTTGKVSMDFGGYDDRGLSVAVQSDGKIVIAGYSYGIGSLSIAVARYNGYGTLDPSFNGTGKVSTAIGGSIGNSVAVQADGKIVVAGSGGTSFAVVRYNTDGSLDTTFNGTGKVTTSIGGINDSGQSVAIQSDGKIVVAGYSDNGSKRNFALVRYNANGSLDTSFSGTGKITTAIGDYNDFGLGVALQNDGKIVVAGYSENAAQNASIFALVRYTSNGSLDSSFGDMGKVTVTFGDGLVSRGSSVVIQRDGKIVVAGSSGPAPYYNFAVLRCNVDGSLDTRFHGTGKVTTTIGNGGGGGSSVALQGDGKIVVAGSAFTPPFDPVFALFALVRYEGDPDTDGDGISDWYETGTGIYVSPTDTGTDPNKADTDGDGLTDGQEIYTHHTNPNIKDTDNDGFDDGFEVATGFSPTSAASTPDALSSIRTAAEYRFNAALGISYRIEASTDFTNWTTIETNIIGAGGVITRFYSIEGQPRRFFRSRRN